MGTLPVTWPHGHSGVVREHFDPDTGHMICAIKQAEITIDMDSTLTLSPSLIGGDGVKPDNIAGWWRLLPP